MANYVLVHGGWHGAWCWERVVPLLTAAGHTVATPTLAGLGERVTELRPEIDLELHVTEVTESIEPDGPRDVVLVGHSYSGMVVAAVAARRAGRISRLVYLDAFVPEDGQSMFDIAPPGRPDSMREQVRLEGDGWKVPIPPAQWMGITDDDEVRWLTERLTPQSIATLEQPVRFGATEPDSAIVPRHFIHCLTDPPSITFLPFVARARSSPGWTLHEMTTGHDAMLTAPHELAQLLLTIAQ